MHAATARMTLAAIMIALPLGRAGARPRVVDRATPAGAVPHTLSEALAAAYLTNPALRQERAILRAQDEGVPTALAGWRPQISGQAGATYYTGHSNYRGTGDFLGYSRVYSTPGYMAGVNIQQPIYSGGKTTASTHQAVNRVMAERANLIAVEQKVFQDVVNAYIGVVEDTQLLKINQGNEHVLADQLRATEARFRDGEITRTDVDQAQAALAAATSQRQQAEGTLDAARATYLQQVGAPASADLLPPQPLALPTMSEAEVETAAAQNNPDVINALFTQSAQKDAIDVAVSALMPKLTAEAAYQRGVNQGLGGQFTENAYAELTMQVPLYQGGAEYAAIRQARQQAQADRQRVDVQRRQAVQQASAAWRQLLAARASLASDRLAITASTAARDGVRRQALEGASTTLEVLQQQQALLQSEVTLVQGLGTLVNASYGVAAAIGRLTAADLALNVPLYDEKAYYRAVKDRLWSMNDYARDQPGR
ncbi:secretion system type I outer membrane protein TolC [Gluconacetobacter sacchari DSM 12717]|nr:TolC family outer membrane protein [Gluconacetobacter sacchari]GBQ20660.1 secretion system type I outer membrane protein TolC [Gluconacetobacter sacchari DSM 12717]